MYENSNIIENVLDLVTTIDTSSTTAQKLLKARIYKMRNLSSSSQKEQEK